MFRVLTVARECGSGGSLIAKTVAEKLGWNLLDQELVRDVARAAQVDPKSAAEYDEHVDSWWHCFNRDGLRAVSLTAGVALENAQFFDAGTMAAFAQRVISEAATTGNCVIVGRGAECVLRGREDVFSVFIYGPWEERVSRIRNRVNSPQEVAELIRLTDQERARYIQTNYGCNWKDPNLYHMMISSQVGSETATWMIANAIERGGRHGVG